MKHISVIYPARPAPLRSSRIRPLLSLLALISLILLGIYLDNHLDDHLPPAPARHLP